MQQCSYSQQYSILSLSTVSTSGRRQKCISIRIRSCNRLEQTAPSGATVLHPRNSSSFFLKVPEEGKSLSTSKISARYPRRNIEKPARKIKPRIICQDLSGRTKKIHEASRVSEGAHAIIGIPDHQFFHRSSARKLFSRRR